jgi:putative FmdB family regulatory protein
MPIYRYACPADQSTKSLMRKVSEADESVKCQCGAEMARQIGEPHARAVETGDEYHGLKMVQGVREMATERAREHWRKHELPRIVEREGKEFAVRQGFIDEEGNVKI